MAGSRHKITAEKLISDEKVWQQFRLQHQIILLHYVAIANSKEIVFAHNEKEESVADYPSGGESEELKGSMKNLQTLWEDENKKEFKKEFPLYLKAKEKAEKQIKNYSKAHPDTLATIKDKISKDPKNKLLELAKLAYIKHKLFDYLYKAYYSEKKKNKKQLMDLVNLIKSSFPIELLSKETQDAINITSNKTMFEDESKLFKKLVNGVNSAINELGKKIDDGELDDINFNVNVNSQPRVIVNRLNLISKEYAKCKNNVEKAKCIMKYPEVWDAVVAEAKKKGYDENHLFFRDVNKFLNNIKSFSQYDVQQEYKKLWNSYISESADHQINISQNDKVELKSLYENMLGNRYRESDFTRVLNKIIASNAKYIVEGPNQMGNVAPILKEIKQKADDIVHPKKTERSVNKVLNQYKRCMNDITLLKQGKLEGQADLTLEDLNNANVAKEINSIISSQKAAIKAALSLVKELDRNDLSHPDKVKYDQLKNFVELDQEFLNADNQDIINELKENLQEIAARKERLEKELPDLNFDQYYASEVLHEDQDDSHLEKDEKHLQSLTDLKEKLDLIYAILDFTSKKSQSSTNALIQNLHQEMSGSLDELISGLQKNAEIMSDQDIRKLFIDYDDGLSGFLENLNYEDKPESKVYTEKMKGLTLVIENITEEIESIEKKIRSIDFGFLNPKYDHYATVENLIKNANKPSSILSYDEVRKLDFKETPENQSAAIYSFNMDVLTREGFSINGVEASDLITEEKAKEIIKHLDDSKIGELVNFNNVDFKAAIQSLSKAIKVDNVELVKQIVMAHSQGLGMSSGLMIAALMHDEIGLLVSEHKRIENIIIQGDDVYISYEINFEFTDNNTNEILGITPSSRAIYKLHPINLEAGSDEVPFYELVSFESESKLLFDVMHGKKPDTKDVVALLPDGDVKNKLQERIQVSEVSVDEQNRREPENLSFFQKTVNWVRSAFVNLTSGSIDKKEVQGQQVADPATASVEADKKRTEGGDGTTSGAIKNKPLTLGSTHRPSIDRRSAEKGKNLPPDDKGKGKGKGKYVKSAEELAEEAKLKREQEKYIRKFPDRTADASSSIPRQFRTKLPANSLKFDAATRSIPHNDKIRDGEELRNINSFEYLANIAQKIPDELTRIPAGLPKSLRKKYNIFKLVKEACENQPYQAAFPYGNLYSEFLKSLEDLLDKSRFKPAEIKYALDPAEIKDMLDLVYANPNQALERTAAMISDVVERTSHTSKKIESRVTARLIGQDDTDQAALRKIKNKFKFLLNITKGSRTTPQEEGSMPMLLLGLFRRNYKPQHTTGQASVRKYKHQSSDDPKEYRFGTQGQRHGGKARVSPLFESWLEVKKTENTNGIAHVYFNNLGLDRSDIAGKRERALTLELHKLEENHRNVAVITMPADKGLLGHDLLESHQSDISINDAKKRMVALLSGESEEKVKDFKMSPRIKQLVYGDDEKIILQALVDASIEKFGFSYKEKINGAEQQAVYFHLVKYELSRYILNRLQPDSFNMSCKDAIDRGGVSSAYYNLILSIEKNNPMSKDEFVRALHAAPTLVKGRGMNDHSQRIWNAINVYIDGQGRKEVPANIPGWLRKWRVDHAPRYSHYFYLPRLLGYVNKLNEEFNAAGLSIKAESRIRVKLETARKLLTQVNGGKEDFSTEEVLALHSGRLGKIYKGLRNTDYRYQAHADLKIEDFHLVDSDEESLEESSSEELSLSTDESYDSDVESESEEVIFLDEHPAPAPDQPPAADSVDDHPKEADTEPAPSPVISVAQPALDPSSIPYYGDQASLAANKQAALDILKEKIQLAVAAESKPSLLSVESDKATAALAGQARYILHTVRDPRNKNIASHTAAIQSYDDKKKITRSDLYSADKFEVLKNAKRSSSFGYFFPPTSVPGQAVTEWAAAAIQNFMVLDEKMLKEKKQTHPVKIHRGSLPKVCVEAMVLFCQTKGLSYISDTRINVSEKQVDFYKKKLTEWSRQNEVIGSIEKFYAEPGKPAPKPGMGRDLADN